MHEQVTAQGGGTPPAGVPSASDARTNLVASGSFDAAFHAFHLHRIRESRYTGLVIGAIGAAVSAGGYGVVRVASLLRHAVGGGWLGGLVSVPLVVLGVLTVIVGCLVFMCLSMPLVFHWTMYSKTYKKLLPGMAVERADNERNWAELETLVEHGKPFVLYLRNFKTEDAELRPQFDVDFAPPFDTDNPEYEERLEEFAMAPIHKARLPVFAVGNFAATGPRRYREVFVLSSGDAWRAEVERLAAASALVVMVADAQTPGVAHEAKVLTASPPGTRIWLILRNHLESARWVPPLVERAEWITRYKVVPSGDLPDGLEAYVSSLGESGGPADSLAIPRPLQLPSSRTNETLP